MTSVRELDTLKHLREYYLDIKDNYISYVSKYYLDIKYKLRVRYVKILTKVLF